jgi:hypothetical protein
VTRTTAGGKDASSTDLAPGGDFLKSSKKHFGPNGLGPQSATRWETKMGQPWGKLDQAAWALSLPHDGKQKWANPNGPNGGKLLRERKSKMDQCRGQTNGPNALGLSPPHDWKNWAKHSGPTNRKWTNAVVKQMDPSTQDQQTVNGPMPWSNKWTQALRTNKP